MTESLCFDTNIIIGYATYFESKNKKCIDIFKDVREKKTSIRVCDELEIIRIRRIKLYKDVMKYINKNMRINGYKPSIRVNKNDLKHIRNILIELRKVDVLDAVTYLRNINREIKAGIVDAFNKIRKPHIPKFNDVLCEARIHGCIGNINDARMLSDALVWAEKNNRLIFCTYDYNDFIKLKTKIMSELAKLRRITESMIPINIQIIDEIIP